MADLAGQTVTTTNGNSVTYGPDGKPRMTVSPDGTTKYYDTSGIETKNPEQIQAAKAAINSQPNYNVPQTPTIGPAGPQPINPPTNVAALVESGQTPQSALRTAIENPQLTAAQQLNAQAQAAEQTALVNLNEAQLQLGKLTPGTDAYNRAQQSVTLLSEQAQQAETRVQAAQQNLKIEATLAQDAGRITTLTPEEQPNLDQFNVVSANKISAATLVDDPFGQAGLPPEAALFVAQSVTNPDPYNAPPELDATGSLAEAANAPDPYANSPELDATGSLAEAANAPDPYANSPEIDVTGSLFEAANAPDPYANSPEFDPTSSLVEYAATIESGRVSAGVAEARKQQILIDQQRNLNNADWRVRLSLASNSDYLYNVAEPGILDALKPSNGVIFPYTPQIATNYKANYSNYDLTHSNYRGYFYQNSYTDQVVITAAFTAQNTQEANYLLAVIHFFRSVTKMFYGQSPHVGSPPPICYLNGLGEYQFNKHPVLVTNFAYTLPNSVDYIRAGSANNLQLNQNPLRPKTNTANPALASVRRLANTFLKPNVNPITRPPTSMPIKNNPTYVPTKMDIVVTLLPVQSRTQVSQQFNLQSFANGQLLRGGFW